MKVSAAVVGYDMDFADGSWILERLREDEKKEIAITENFLRVVARNIQVIQILVDSREDELRITPRVLEEMAKGQSGDKLIRLFLQEKAYNVIITKDVIEAGSGNSYCGKK